jgi:putative endonuclease
MTKQCKATGYSGAYTLRATIGKLGEEAAIQFYLASGCQLIDRNWRAGRFAELDLIVRHPSGLLIFVEVKTRSVDRQRLDNECTGVESIGWRKRQKIVTAARLFMSKMSAVDLPCRFDVLLIGCRTDSLAHGSGKPAVSDMVHVPDAF